MYLNGVQGNTEFAVDAGRRHRRVVEGEQAEGRRQRLLPAMASKVDTRQRSRGLDEASVKQVVSRGERIPQKQEL